MKKTIQYVLIFITLTVAFFGYTARNNLEKGPDNTYIIKNITQSKKSDLNTFLNLYHSGRFQTIDFVDNSVIEGKILTSSKKISSLNQTITQQNIEIYKSDVPHNTSLSDLGISLTGSTIVTIKNQSTSSYIANILYEIVPFIILIAVFGFLTRGIGGGKGGGMMGGFPFKMSIGREKKEGDKVTTFSDVAGMEEVKGELMEIVDYLKNPDKYTKVGARIPKGVLLYGQPGTGKTLLARAVAGEAGVPFISASGSEFMEMLVGMGAAKVRELFGKAKAQSPAIIFIDEIDAIGKKRGQGQGGGHQEQEQTLNQILTEMDGFETDIKVIVIAATNRPDTLDSALLRSGRFDRKIMVSAPTLEERVMIIQYYLKDKKLEDGLNLMSLAKRMSGFAGADIENIINEAALKLAKDGRVEITSKDIDYGLEKVVMGPEKKARTLNESEREIVTYHELGHAICAHRLPHGDPVEKISIVSRGQALGVTWIMPAEDRYLKSKAKFLDDITGLLGGRAAEEIFFGVDAITTGASNDFERVTAMATDMIVKYGMDAELGTMQFMSNNDYSLTKPYSESTAIMIDSKIRAIVQSCYLKAKELITTDKELMIKLAKLLDAKEYLTREEFEELMTCDLSEVSDKIETLITEYNEEMRIAEATIEQQIIKKNKEKTHE